MAIELRPEVRAFAEAMQRLLDEHQDEKGDGWKDEDVQWLLLDLYHRVDKLQITRYVPTRNATTILRAAASVGVHAMFVADVCGALDTQGEG